MQTHSINVFQESKSLPQNPLAMIVRLTSDGSKFYSGNGWESYHNYIGAPIFYPEYTRNMKDALLNSSKIQNLITSVTNKRLEDYLARNPRYTLEKRGHKDSEFSADNLSKIQRLRTRIERDLWVEIKKVVSGMIAEMDSIVTVRLLAMTLKNVLIRLYNQGIYFREEEVIQLKRVAEMAKQKGHSLIFLPCHKSHVDYLVISYIFYYLGLALPHIAAGDNLNIPIIGWILRHGGAFFIRRTWGSDVIYNTVMKEYIEILLQQGHNIEAFIEGTRSRVGKLLSPKFGILKIILDTILNNKVSDCIIVPIYIGYDRVIESSSYISELLGKPKEKESLQQLWNSTEFLQLRWGRIDIRFADPISLKEYVDSQKATRGPKFLPESNAEDKNYMLLNLGYRILSSINSVSVIMPTALVGTALLTLRGRGVGKEELIRKVEVLIRLIQNKGGSVCDFYGTPTGVIVERAIQNLKDLVGHRMDLLESVYYPVKRFELSFYRNQVIHLFIQEAIVAVGLYATIKNGGSSMEQRVLHNKPKFTQHRRQKITTPMAVPEQHPPLTNGKTSPTLLEEAIFLSSLFRGEFVYSPKALAENLGETVRALVQNEVIYEHREVSRCAVLEDVDFFVEEERVVTWIGLTATERKIGRENFDFYCFLLWPFLDTYWLAAASLLCIIPNVKPSPPKSKDDDVVKRIDPSAWVTEQTLMSRAQFFGKTLYYEGDLTYFESINKETLKNGFDRLKDMGVILFRKGVYPPGTPVLGTARDAKETIKTWVALHPDWVPLDTHTPKENESLKPTAQPQQKPAHCGFAGSSFREIPQGRLWDLCDSIGRFRREGKKRRDNASVASRVLRLSRMTIEWDVNNSKKNWILVGNTRNLATNTSSSTRTGINVDHDANSYANGGLSPSDLPLGDIEEPGRRHLAKL